MSIAGSDLSFSCRQKSQQLPLSLLFLVRTDALHDGDGAATLGDDQWSSPGLQLLGKRSTIPTFANLS